MITPTEPGEPGPDNPLRHGLTTITTGSSVRPYAVTEYLYRFTAAPYDGTCSSVLRLSWKRIRFLFAADAFVGQAGEPLESLRGKLRSDVLEIPHHGYSIPRLSELLDEAKPSLAILSVGPSPYPAPDNKTIETLDRKGIRLLRTDSVVLPPPPDIGSRKGRWGRLTPEERADANRARSRYGIVLATDGETVWRLPPAGAGW